MCGIYCAVTSLKCSKSKIFESKESRRNVLLRRRGPDKTFTVDLIALSWRFYFEAHVLWMQGKKLVVQPSVDELGNILLWNGDIFSGIYKKASEDISDTAVLLRALAERTPAGVCDIFSQVSGPWSVVYWSQSNKTLWFGRDLLGRHSLLWCKRNNSIILSSVAEKCQLDEFLEVPAIGLFSIDFKTSVPDSIPVPMLYPWSHLMPELKFQNDLGFDQFLGSHDVSSIQFTIANEIIKSQINLGSHAKKSLEDCPTVPNGDIEISPPNEALDILRKSWVGVDGRVDALLELLKESVKTRVKTQPRLCKNCIKDVDGIENNDICCKHPKVCVLFSGGIDSTILALLVNLFVPPNEAIDLLNVAFAKEKSEGSFQELDVAGESDSDHSLRKEKKNGCPKGISKKSQGNHTFSDVPDRITGKQALTELTTLCPTRKWNFVEIDVTVSELNKVRQEFISDLIHPLNTVLDDSLGCAMWFAARGFGTLHSVRGCDDGESFSITEKYTSPARVAILGNGADEQLGGYSRHRSSLEDGGWSLLTTEISRQMKNLPSRNLGRDDRICSDHGRQPRFPFLDEAVVTYLSSLPPWEKVAAHVLTSTKKSRATSERTILTLKSGVGDKALLRLLALKLGLKKVCTFPKRAMQFGTRVAKLEATGKEKASDICERLKTS